jgi:hypothetical protein
MLPMKKTQRKLSEAKFFLVKMEEEYDKHEDFEYYFSAFISSCRSVLWVLKAECKGHADWLNWYEGLKPEDEEAEFLKKTNNIRVRSEKHTPVEAGLMETLALDKTAMPNEIYKLFQEGKSSDLDIEFYDQNRVLIDGEYVVPILANKLYKQVDEFEGDEIMDVSKKYYGLVSSVVEKSLEYIK